MTTAPATTPPWMWLLAVVVVGVIAAAPGLVVAIRNGKHVEKASATAERVEKTTDSMREQVTNGHTTNLRDDLDRVDSKVDRLSGTVEAHHRTVMESMRDLRESLARQDRIAARHHPEEN